MSVVFDVLRRRRVLGALETFRSGVRDIAEKAYLLDLYTLGDHIVALALRALSKVRPQTTDDVTSVLRQMSAEIRENLPYSFPALFLADVLDTLSSRLSGFQATEALERARRTLTAILEYSANSYNALTINLSKAINHGSTITLLGYSNSILRLILSISGKLAKVNVLSYWPFMNGRRAALLLRKRGIKAEVWPDVALSQILEESDYAIAATLGVSSEDVIIGEMGLYPMFIVASDLGKESIAIAWSMSLRLTTPPNLEIVEKLEHPIEKSETIHLPLFDLVPSSRASAVITEMGVYRPPLGRAIEDVYETLLRRIIDTSISQTPQL